ncbi:PQ loop repeat protein-like protein [Periconia macrospinosa]|uniref:PQ loop repeat protein-like protein n=1 Tax=Periconia macrospinosa TaxID=97972 RepID=A0A2V1DGL4_9PLEO|nr:PQ loop repeat protein-like protein [Periconia macrospinosa]
MYATDRCQELAHPDMANFAVSVFILVGILVSYLPQHYKIISRRSSRGLSPMFVLLGTVSGTASIANILTLPESTRDMGCCREIGGFPCAAALLGIAQIGVQWSCFFMIKLLFLIFFPHPSDSDDTESGQHDASAPTWKEAIMVLTLSMTFFVFVLFGSVIFVYGAPDHIRSWANFLGLLGSAFATVQYIPQILTTWRLQEVGSLSIPMMCLQTPGSALFAASLAVRLGPAGWSAWGIFILTGALQGCLLTMCLWFVWRDRKIAKASNGHVGNGNGISHPAGDEGSEQTPLLGNER